MVAGYNVAADVDGKIRFYDTTFQVASKLERTGMGYDNSVFMTFDTLYKLKDSEVAQVHLPTDDLENVISMLMIDVDDSFEGMDLASLKIDIENSGPSGEKMYACTADDLMSGIASQVKQLSGYGNILIYILLIATALALISIFVITINERKYEFGILYTVGANKSQITRIILSEALIISICGGAAGVLISYYLLVEFKDIIRTQLNIPYFDIPLQMGLTVTALCMTIAIITGIIAAVCSSYRISKGEAYRLIRESE
ncbi:MAG: ABC transporter permease [Lachnospiraceae bacterium]